MTRSTLGLIALLALVTLPLRSQFGGYSSDLPFMGSDSESVAEPVGVDLYEYWSLDTDSITNNLVRGLAGRENILTPSAPAFPAQTVGISGGGLLFNANVAQSLNVGNTNAAHPVPLYGTNSWTIALWLDVDRESTNVASTAFCTGDTIASLWRNAASHYQGWRLGYSAEDPGLTFRIRQNYSQWVKLDLFPLGSQMTNGWFHLAFGYDGSVPGIWFQTNGGPRQVSYVTNAIAPMFIDPIHPLSLGNVGDGSRGYVGKMDEVGFWIRALSTNEVSRLHGNATNALVYSATWGADQIRSNNPSPGLFDPRTIPDMVFGVDALRPYTLVNASKQTVPAHGQLVTNWHNIVTNTIVFNSIHTALPIYYTNGAGSNGNRPRLFFTNNAALQSVITSSPSSATNTYVIVHDANPTPGGRLLSATSDSFGQVSSANDAGLTWYFYFGGWIGPFRYYRTNYTVTTFILKPNSQVVRTNGVLMESRTSSLGSGMNVGIIGATREGGVPKYFWNANISRVYRWARELATNELEQVENACRQEYGI